MFFACPRIFRVFRRVSFFSRVLRVWRWARNGEGPVQQAADVEDALLHSQRRLGERVVEWLALESPGDE